jgi:hypothetical protein
VLNWTSEVHDKHAENWWSPHDDFICFGLCFAATEGSKAAGTH